MGRLDDAAKHKVVELRKAGLSFRKIKAVLELENIKVSAQAIYLFLREYQGRPPGRVRPVEAGSGITTAAQAQARVGAIQDWRNIHLQNLLQEVSHQSGYTTSADFAKQTSSNPGVKPSNGGGSRSEQHGTNKDENDIQIVSVTSLAQNNQQRGSQSSVTQAETSASTMSAAAALMRRRVTPSPATNSMLAARKRLLDKALSHRMKQSIQQVASLIRRDESSVQGSEIRNAMPQQPPTYDLTTEKTVVEGQPGGSSKRFLPQRPSVSVRSPHPLPRVGIRLPNRPGAPSTSSAAGGSGIIRLQTPTAQGVNRSEPIPNYQQAAQDPATRGLQDQIQVLGSEMRSLGLAVKMLVEQQCRLEREQVQQTHIQKQILSTLQSLSFKVGQCGSSQQQHDKTPSPSALPRASSSPSFSQDNFSFSQGTYPQCSQTPQPSFNSLEGLENVEAFKLPGLSPTGMNGFPPCSNAESLPLSHAPSQTQPFAAAYAQQAGQTRMPPYTQSYVPSYTQSHSQTFRMSESNTSDFPGSCSARSLQDCSVSAQPMVDSNPGTQDQQINTIKVEGP